MNQSISGLAKEFMKVKRPLPNGTIRSVPKVAAYFISFLIRLFQKMHSGEPSLPGGLGKIINLLTNYDIDFSQAWLDGRIYEGLDHADALSRATCPILLLHANWVCHPDYGLVGAMDDADAARAKELAHHMVYKRIDSDHVTHNENTEEYLNAVDEFAAFLY